MVHSFRAFSRQRLPRQAHPQPCRIHSAHGNIMKRFVHTLGIAFIAIVGFNCLWSPDLPTPASPADGSAGISTEPTLRWNAASGAASYRLQISTDPTFSTITMNDSMLTVPSHRVTGLSRGTTYFWRVRANDSYGRSGWSAILSFTTVVPPPEAPTPSAPINGSTGITTEPMLCWDPPPHATSYQLQVATDSSFSAIIFDKKGITSTFYPDSGLTIGTRYYWRVNASNAGGTSDWSRTRTFTPGGL
jgi:hypothetical protein